MTTDCSLPDTEVQRLLHAAFEAQKNSYSPYSHYPVGAAVLLEDGSIFTGCNVENASYPAGFCAEQNAIGSAIAAGKLNFQAIAVVGSEDTYTTPCGICRQVLAEFHVPYIICGKKLSDWTVYRLEELLPHSFEKQWEVRSEKLEVKEGAQKCKKRPILSFYIGISWYNNQYHFLW